MLFVFNCQAQYAIFAHTGFNKPPNSSFYRNVFGQDVQDKLRVSQTIGLGITYTHKRWSATAELGLDIIRRKSKENMIYESRRKADFRIADFERNYKVRTTIMYQSFYVGYNLNPKDKNSKFIVQLGYKPIQQIRFLYSYLFDRDYMYIYSRNTCNDKLPPNGSFIDAQTGKTISFRYQEIQTDAVLLGFNYSKALKTKPFSWYIQGNTFWHVPAKDRSKLFTSYDQRSQNYFTNFDIPCDRRLREQSTAFSFDIKVGISMALKARKP
jgi:hypothetical protein